MAKEKLPRKPQGAKSPEPSEPPDAFGVRSEKSLVVGVGASAGGTDAFLQLLGGLPRAPGFAIAFVLHQLPHHEKAIVPRLAEASPLPVAEAKDGMSLDSDHLYVIPPGVEMIVADQTLRVSQRSSSYRPQAVIDAFFRSLTDEMQGRAIGVVLSGAGRDGAAGLREIQAAGGIALAQTPQSAAFDAMPRAALDAGAVDLLRAPAEIGPELVRLASLPPWQDSREAERLSISEQQEHRLFAQLRRATAIDFSEYKRSAMKRRVERRMAIAADDSLDRYLERLEDDLPEVNRLIEDLLTCSARFFSPRNAFDETIEEAFDELLRGHEDGVPLRVWIPGCGSGEAAYSAAIVLAEAMTARGKNLEVKIFATDTNQRAIDRARAGSYPLTTESDISDQRLLQFFHRLDGSYRIDREIREMCVFARQDVLRDSPFSRMDLILWRDVLNDFDALAQRKLESLFHYSLRPGGLLMHACEPAGPVDSKRFAPNSASPRLLRRLPLEKERLSATPVAEPAAKPQRELSAPPAKKNYVHAEANRLLLNRYAPPDARCRREAG